MTKPPSRRAWLPPQPEDFRFIIWGREYRWLSRLVGLILAPLERWRLRRFDRSRQ